MAVKFNQTPGQWLTSDYSFPSAGAYRNVRLVLDLETPTVTSSMHECFVQGRAISGTIELTVLNLHTQDGVNYSNGYFTFRTYWSGAYALWRSTNSVLTTGINEIFVTYDGSSTANNPTFYLNGSSIAITRVTAPSGTLGNNTITNCTLGGVGYASPNGKLIACNFITGRVVSAAEVLETYNSRAPWFNPKGLVFSPNLNGAADVKEFDTTVLSATNFILDDITGTKFTPQNSPVAAADKYLTIPRR